MIETDILEERTLADDVLLVIIAPANGIFLGICLGERAGAFCGYCYQTSVIRMRLG